jgi:uncharacterized cupredoxin-like copper-binding protein
LTLLVLAGACGDDDSATPSPSISPTESAEPTENSSPSPTSIEGDGTPSPTLEPVDTDAAIDLTEFAIEPQRTSARPGTVTFHVRNTGELTHEFLVIRTDLPHAELPRLEDGLGADESQLNVVGRIDPIESGENADLTLDLQSGNYVLICNLASDSTSHYLSGMYDRFVVSDTAAPPDAPTQ